MKFSRCAWVCAAAGLAGVAATAGSASAVVSWETRTRLLVNGVPATSAAVPDGPVTITVQTGIFNLTGAGPGQENHGLSLWTGRVNSTVTGLGVNNATSRFQPFNFGPATTFGGFVTGGGTGIDGSSTPGSSIFCARAIAPTENIPWLDGWAEPGTPIEYGIDSYTSVFRFTYTMSSAVTSNVVINVTNAAGPIIAWVPFTEQPPNNGNPGFVNFLGVSPSPATLAGTTATLTLTRIPAPGTVGLLALGAPLALRRRRR